MTLEELCRKLKTFPPYVESGDGYIVDVTEKWLIKYLKLVEKVDEEEFLNLKESKEDVVQRIKKVNKIISDSITKFLEGKFSEASNDIYDLFFNITRSDRTLMACQTETEKTYYRLRSCDSNHLYSKWEMFHIPFESRGNIGNQRFSISGYPCLYLGRSIYGCWEELDRPEIDTLNMVAMKSIEPLILVNLVPPPRIKTKHILCRIPLDIACSLKIYNPKDYFKPQYIIPQLVLQCVLRRNQAGGIKLKNFPMKKNIDGICYVSSHVSDKQCLFSEESLFVNYVIPVKSVKKRGLCPELCKKFQVSDPNSVNIGKIYNEIPIPSEQTDRYGKSLFGIMEEKLNASGMDYLEPER